jgi:hypothetical protein
MLNMSQSTVSFGGLSCSYAKRSIRAMSQLEMAMSASAAVFDDEDDEFSDDPSNVLKEKAVTVLSRVRQKLTGTDFVDGLYQQQGGAKTPRAQEVALDVPEQVDRLINLATSNEQLCLSFFGWCPFW